MNANLPEHRMRAGDAERDRALTAIQKAYEAGRLDLDEMRDRQEKALKSKYTDELPALVADLPERAMLEFDPYAAPGYGGAGYPDVATHLTGLPETAPAEAGATVSIMSGRDIVVESGTRHLTNFAWWGGNNYDLSDAMGPGRIVTLTLHAIMGGNNIYVPDGVRVIDRSVAIMAGNDIKRRAQGDGSNGTLVIEGFLWWAGNDVDLADDQRPNRRRPRH